MADGDTAGKVRLDDIVAQVVPDPAQTAGATLLTGFIGKGDADGRLRIYPDLSFGTYYDVAEADVVHSVPLPAESSPHGGSHVWVKPGADIKPGPASAQAAQAAGQAQFAAAFPRTRFECTMACTDVGATCPNGDCTLFGTCPHVCHQPTQMIRTCGPRDCTIACAVAGAFQPAPAAFAAAAPLHTVHDCTLGCNITHAAGTCPTGHCTFPGMCGPPPTNHRFTCASADCTIACAAAQQQAPVQPAAALPFSLQESCGIACTYVPPCPPPIPTNWCTPNCTLPSITCTFTPVTLRTGVFCPFGG